jgi:hypothetical protein
MCGRRRIRGVGHHDVPAVMHGIYAAKVVDNKNSLMGGWNDFNILQARHFHCLFFSPKDAAKWQDHHWIWFTFLCQFLLQ